MRSIDGRWNAVHYPSYINCVQLFASLCHSLLILQDQNPVDISKAGVTLINNSVGLIVVPRTLETESHVGSWDHLGDMGTPSAGGRQLL